MLLALCPLTSHAQNAERQKIQRLIPKDLTASNLQTIDPCTPDEQCNSLTESASNLSRMGQYAAALSTYIKAYTLKPSAWIFINIGRVQQKMGKPQEAIASYKQFLSSPAAEHDAEMATTARQYLKQAEQDLAHPRKPKVILMKEELAPRPLWRLALGGTFLGVGLTGIAIGAYGLGVNGKCVDDPIAPKMVCSEVRQGLPTGLGFLISGSLVAVAGAITIALPGPKRRVQVEEPSANSASTSAATSP